jgi:hypothetical protein
MLKLNFGADSLKVSVNGKVLVGKILYPLFVAVRNLVKYS